MLRSKAQVSIEELGTLSNFTKGCSDQICQTVFLSGDQYCMFGPMKHDSWRLEVEKVEPENRSLQLLLVEHFVNSVAGAK